MKLRLVRNVRHLELLAVGLIVVVLGIVVWRACVIRQQVLDTYQQNVAISTGQPAPINWRGPCTLADKTKGKLFVATGSVYRLCIPNGWVLYQTADGTNKIGTSLISGGADMLYSPDVAPAVRQTGGKDGPFALHIGYSTAAIMIAQPYANAGTIKAANITGTHYRKVQTTLDAEGMGALPKGTVSHLYLFRKNNLTFTLSYNLFPGSPDDTSRVEQMAQTLSL